MLSQDIIIDEAFNSLSIQAQNVFIRLLAVSDDFGFVPANEYTLDKLINTPKKTNLTLCLREIIAAGLGHSFPYDGREFFLFKRDRFDDYQSYLIAKRTKSEYLRLSKDEILSENFQEILRNYRDVGTTSIESIKHKVESVKQKEESKKRFVAPLEQEVIDFFAANGFPASVATKAFRYYSEANWHDAKGSPVKNWKQKMISVWFKDENRAQAKPAIRGPKLKTCAVCKLEYHDIICPRCYPEKSDKRKDIPMPKEVSDAIAKIGRG